MISKEVKEKLSKVYELVKNGATEGEKEAAQKALEKLLSKYNLEDIDLESLDLSRYTFKYTSTLELSLFQRVVIIIANNNDALKTAVRQTGGVKNIVISLTHLDYITVSAAYEYFRRHMKAQWLKVSRPSINRCKSAKTKTKRLKELQEVFFSQYVIASKLYEESELKKVDATELSRKELEDRRKMREVQGGTYRRQMTSGLLLEQ